MDCRVIRIEAEGSRRKKPFQWSRRQMIIVYNRLVAAKMVEGDQIQCMFRVELLSYSHFPSSLLSSPWTHLCSLSLALSCLFPLCINLYSMAPDFTHSLADVLYSFAPLSSLHLPGKPWACMTPNFSFLAAHAWAVECCWIKTHTWADQCPPKFTDTTLHSGYFQASSSPQCLTYPLTFSR